MAANHGFGRKAAHNLIRSADREAIERLTVEDITIVHDRTVPDDSAHDIEDARDADVGHRDPSQPDPRPATQRRAPRDLLAPTRDDAAPEVSWERSGLIEESSRGKRPRPAAWWVGVLALPLLGLLAVAVWWGMTRVEDGVEDAAREILVAAGVDTSTLTFEADLQDVEVGGVLPTGVSAAEIENLLENGTSSSGRDIRNATVVAIAIVEPIDLTVTADGTSILLDGQVATDAQRDQLGDAAEASGAAVTNNIAVTDRDANPGAADRIELLTAVLALFDDSVTEAQLTLVDGRLDGIIETTNGDARRRFESIPGLADSSVSLTALGELRVEITYDGRTVLLNGDVLTDEQSAELVDAALDAVGRERVVNNLTVLDADESIPGSDAKVGAVAGVMRVIGGFESADAQLDDNRFTLNGRAVDPDSRVPIDDAIGAVTEAGLRTGGDITLRFDNTLEEEIDLLQAELDALEDEIFETVRFGTDSDQLSEAAGLTLDQVVDAMKRHTRPVVEVGGHTDSTGDPDTNRELSEERAAAVVSYLTDAGVRADRLRPVGFGESEPRADNTTEAGREQNRRVEFTARETF